jgi:hypothetical protein
MSEDGKKGAAAVHAQKDERGKSKHALKCHAKKDEKGRSLFAVKAAEKLHAEKDELGRSVTAMRTNSQVWMSTVDGFTSTAGPVSQHNKAIGADPEARIRIK